MLYFVECHSTGLIIIFWQCAKQSTRTVFLFRGAREKIDDFIADENHRIIIEGDFNVANDPGLDCSGGMPKEKESIKFLNSICLNYMYDLIAIWRTRNPDCKH